MMCEPNDTNTQSHVTIAPDELRQFVEKVYRQTSLTEAAARLMADTLVQADIWGHQSHGVLRVPWYFARLRSGAINGAASPRIVHEAGAITVIDGCDALGQQVAQFATDQAVRRAEQHGLVLILVRNSNHFGTCMYFTRQAAERGFIAMLMSNAGPNMAPWGGLKKKIGTNPWSIAVPARKSPVVMDMANSGVARGKIYLAAKRREPIPLGWAVDKHGRPTTDPREAIEGFILPMAGHKGYVMGVMVDILSGVLSGSQYLDAVHGPYDPVNRSGAGHFMLAVKVDAIQPLNAFLDQMDDYIASLKDVPLAEGHRAVYYPGELEEETAARNAVEGLRLPADTVRGLIDTAKLAGVSCPFSI